MKIKRKSLILILLAASLNAKVPSGEIEVTPKDISAQNIYDTVLHSGHTKSMEEARNRFDLSMEDYLTKQYNLPRYADYISQNGSDLLTLLDAVNESDMTFEDRIIKTYTVFKLFNDKLKATQINDDLMLMEVLPAMPTLISRYFKVEELTSIDEMKCTIEYQLQLKLLENFEEFADKPESCISKISSELAKQQHSLLDRFENVSKLRGMVARFFEGVINKTMWSARNHNDIWPSVITISNGLKGLLDNKIIDDEDTLDGLYWSLVHRLCFFLDLRGAILPLDFYTYVESNLETPFLQEEQDDFIETKKETLIKALTKAKIKAMAFHQNGIITDSIN